MVYLAKGSFWLSVGQVIAVLSSFALSVVLAHSLSQDVYGNYKFILSLAGIVGALSLSGFGTVLTQAVARGADGSLFLAVKTQLKWGNLVALVGLIMSAYYFWNGNTVVGISLIIISIALPLTNSTGLYGSFLSGKKDFKRSTLYWTVCQLVNIGAVMILAVYTHNVVALVAGYFFSNLLTSFYFYKKTLKIYQPQTENADQDMIGQGSHLSAMAFIGTIANQLDKILVFHYAGAAPLAVYSFANAIPEQIKGFFKNIMNVGSPKLALLEGSALRKSISDKILRLTFFAVVGVAIYYVLAPYIFELFFPKYMESVLYSRLYMIGLIFFPGISLFSLYFQLTKETKSLYALTIIGNIATAIFSLILIPKYGTLGAVIENSLSWFVMLSVGFYLFLRKR
jgi:O-antigen/teichoic acid export membrane protein